MEKCKNITILLAAGSGKRFDHKIPKQFVRILGKTILEHTLDNLNSVPSIDEIYLICHSDYVQKLSHLINKYKKIKKILPGSSTRGESIKKGLGAISDFSEQTKIIVHDAVRPLISPTIIDDIFKLLDTYEMVQSVSEPSTDIVIENQFYHRSKVKLGSGPEGANLGLLRKAYRLNSCNSVLEACSSITSKIATIDTNPENIKVTYSTDVIALKQLLKRTH